MEEIRQFIGSLTTNNIQHCLKVLLGYGKKKLSFQCEVNGLHAIREDS